MGTRREPALWRRIDQEFEDIVSDLESDIMSIPKAGKGPSDGCSKHDGPNPTTGFLTSEEARKPS
jgi:hypothetical protein